MSIDSLRTRLNYYGKDPEDRLVKDKRRSLDKALLYSYQGMTISLLDREDPTKFTRDFRCLLNPNKLNLDYDNKILSIPYEEIQLNAPRVGKTSEGQVDTLIKNGDVFYCKETDTYWIVYMQHLEERAYFRAEVRLCEKVIEIDGIPYHVYFRGPIEQLISWHIKKGDIWNDLNYSGLLFITKNEQTKKYFHRFASIEIDSQKWEVQVVNEDSGDGIIKMTIKEDYNNTIEKESEKYKKEQERIKEEAEKQITPPQAYITGPKEIKPYDRVTFEVHGMPFDQNAVWKLSNKKATIISVGDYTMTMEVLTGRQGEIVVSYIYGPDEDDKIDYLVKIKSL